jgi:hypothetical protein
MSAVETELVPVAFHGDTVWAVEDADGVFVPLKPICENLGLNWRSQWNRLRRDEVLSEGVVVMTTPSPGGAQESTCLPLELLPGWLFGVDVNRVKPEIRDKLRTYRAECFKVLWAHFRGRVETAAEVAAGERPAAVASDYGNEAEWRLWLEVVRTAQRVRGRRAAKAIWDRSPLPREPGAAAVQDVSDVARFVREAVRAEAGARVQASDLYAAYCAWCAGQDETPATQAGFGRALGELGVGKVKAGGRMVYEGVAV